MKTSHSSKETGRSGRLDPTSTNDQNLSRLQIKCRTYVDPLLGYDTIHTSSLRGINSLAGGTEGSPIVGEEQNKEQV